MLCACCFLFFYRLIFMDKLNTLSQILISYFGFSEFLYLFSHCLEIYHLFELNIWLAIILNLIHNNFTFCPFLIHIFMMKEFLRIFLRTFVGVCIHFFCVFFHTHAYRVEDFFIFLYFLFFNQNKKQTNLFFHPFSCIHLLKGSLPDIYLHTLFLFFFKWKFDKKKQKLTIQVIWHLIVIYLLVLSLKREQEKKIIRKKRTE